MNIVYVFSNVKFILFLLWWVWIEFIEVGMMVVRDVVVVIIIVFLGDILRVWNKKNSIGIIIMLLFMLSIFVSMFVNMFVFVSDNIIVRLFIKNCMWFFFF